MARALLQWGALLQEEQSRVIRYAVMVGSAARGRGVGSNEGGQDKHDWEKFPHTVERNLPLTYGFTFETTGFAYPCVPGEPLVQAAAQWTVGPAEKYRGRAKDGWINKSAGGDCLPGLRAADHNHAHEEHSFHDHGPHVPPVCEEKTKAQ